MLVLQNLRDKLSKKKQTKQQKGAGPLGSMEQTRLVEIQDVLTTKGNHYFVNWTEKSGIFQVIPILTGIFLFKFL